MIEYVETTSSRMKFYAIIWEIAQIIIIQIAIIQCEKEISGYCNFGMGLIICEILEKIIFQNW